MSEKMIEKPEADELVQKGQLRIWAAFEVLAINEDAAKTALQNHVTKLENDARVKLYKKQFSDIKRVEKPLPKIELGFSYVCETEFVVKNLDKLIQLVIEYGPSSIELLEPKEVKTDVTDVQSILNRISEIMHKFAAMGLGGILVAGKK
jgi:hypothetical protein